MAPTTLRLLTRNLNIYHNNPTLQDTLYFADIINDFVDIVSNLDTVLYTYASK